MATSTDSNALNATPTTSPPRSQRLQADSKTSGEERGIAGARAAFMRMHGHVEAYA
ncbi:hypothetical protein [Janthinobacterium sp. HLX7-2]|uniref:hypothetical protein n=1 Tax=Janthinobacterium sp. HLX7-2 TaxID=1259331 RepID=UPI003F25BB35